MRRRFHARPRRPADTSKRPRKSLTRLSAARLRRVIAHIRAHLGDDLALATLAEVAGIAPEPFVPMFRQATGMVPSQLVLHERIARACTLLRHSPLSVGDIAAAVGIPDQREFGRGLYRVVGITPQRFRAHRGTIALRDPQTSE